ncbi:sequence-specific DNA binding transcription factor [Raphanus sativus]|nr:sequence-specific DNA binding transcription factor [Raphanus sativus]
MLTLEIPQNPPNPQNPVQFQHPHPHPYTTADQQTHQQQQQQQQQMKPLYPSPYATPKPTTTKQQLSPLSVGVGVGGGEEEDDRGSGSGSGCHPEDSSAGTTTTDGKRKISPWHRMKWTDTMVRLLIMAVFYIGDEAGGLGGGDQTADAAAKKKISTGILQKKGKWKSVSRAMVEKGFSVSPQQCEDKFNDLNKRYKRVNDILGRGTACRVVENQGLLETMDLRLTPKLKDEVKKLLNSKHLFFKEMCAYHNSCGHLDQPNVPDQVVIPVPVIQSKPDQQGCFHAGKIAREVEEEESDMAEDSETEIEDTDEEEEEETRRKKRRRVEGVSVKRMREETARVLDDPGKSAWEKKEWMRRKALELEERKVGYEWEAVEMEKQKVKWIRYRSKKEREMEKAKLENQRRSLETERMVLILRRREIEITELQLAGKRVDPSSATG